MASYNTTIDFELAEIIAELELPVRKTQPLKPLKSGNNVYDLTLVKNNINKQRFVKGAVLNSSVLLKQFSGKPLVICFYSSAWQHHGLHYLKQWNVINREITRIGANLLVVSPDEGGQLLEQTIWDNSLYLNFYYDPENSIAQKFGIYSDEAPAWDKYPGIDVNVPLLAVYVVNSDNQIIFDYVDKDLKGPVSSPGLLEALRAEESPGHKRKSA
ncbi:redoxin domain-containing protein [Mucilaginibacter xinganensis]|uniref:Alkyl hydroperoxide reductase subunit C/ Thiol specific antioxidant domain-containing protein n=1 Tax=Mucilaginibacter xinganensis TaxID=1234841 RepID=A0A223NVP4_9SPHI|nr:redoxin domain-containing protein [Mucilaginibacter xinganensis]ASU33945.1 hypothetical protein MuYL_2053 [Mucilaginibacter xinganensis]